MSLLKRLVLWLTAALAVLVLAVGVFLAMLGSRGERQIAAQEIVARRDEAPGILIPVGGHEYHAMVLGDPRNDATGAPVVLIHGFGPAGHDFVLPLGKELARSRAVIVPDLLGFGYSERVLTPGPYYTAAGRAMALAELLDALGVTAADLVGHSYGGAVAGHLALVAPQRVRRVALVCPQIFPQFQPGKVVAFLPRSLARTAVWSSLGGGPTGFAARQCEERPESCGAHRITLIRGTVDALIAINNTPRNDVLPAMLASVEPPALVVWGDDDPIVPPESSAAVAEALSAQTMVVSGGGHWPYATDPAGVTARLLRFLNADKEASRAPLAP